MDMIPTNIPEGTMFGPKLKYLLGIVCIDLAQVLMWIRTLGPIEEGYCDVMKMKMDWAVTDRRSLPNPSNSISVRVVFAPTSSSNHSELQYAEQVYHLNCFAFSYHRQS
jgi:hypothetical protein